MAARLYVISGASCSGKSTLLKGVVDSKLGDATPKYTEREHRQGGFDETIHVEDIEDPKIDCDVIYQIDDRRYGVSTREILRRLDSDIDQFVVLSDFNVIRRLKQELENRLTAIHIASAIDPQKMRAIQRERHPSSPSLEQMTTLGRSVADLNGVVSSGSWPGVVEAMGNLNKVWGAFFPENAQYQKRAEKIMHHHIAYVHNLTLFDHVILNYRKPDEMITQASQIVRFYRANPGGRRRASFPPVFMVTAAPSAGKGTLLDGMRFMGPKQIAIVSKYAKREKQHDDKRDGMVALGRSGRFPDGCEWCWSFHKGPMHEGTEYAVRPREIRQNIGARTPQILVANMGQIDAALDLFGQHMVFLHLHANLTEEEVRAQQARRCSSTVELDSKMKEINDVYSSYIENVARVDHVLLNTAFKEDLLSQMFSLLDHYRDPA